MGMVRREFNEAWATALEGPTRLLLWLSLASLIAYGVLITPEPQTRHIILKAMGVGLLSLTALITARKADGFLLAFALGFGALGDVLIALPDGFQNGLGAFLIGHILYIALFVKNRLAWAQVGVQRKIALISLIAAAFTMIFTLDPYLGALALPVKIYTLILTAMAANALVSRLSILVSIGAVAFFLSDGLIAVGRFLGPVMGESPFWHDLPYVIWGLYAVGQLLIFLGVRKST